YWLWNQATRTGRSFRGTHSAEGLPGHLPNLSETPDLLHHLAFGHRRFSIIDLSVAGHQPMQARDVVLLYNGEIYNFQALRSELESLGHTFSSRSDAEVVISAYRQWGTDCFARFRGFFALALFDTRDNTLVLARDPLGKAPLYVLRRPGACYFASDIKPLFAACPEERTKVRAGAVTEYIGHSLRDVGNRTFWENITTLPAASWLQIDLKTGESTQATYWTIPEQRLSSNNITLENAAVQLRHLLSQSLLRRLVADRQVGFTLSGGLDSSALLALYAQTPDAPKMPVFTVQFSDPKYNETAFARQVIQRYPAHFEHIMVDGEARTLADEWDTFMEIQEEPFHDPALFTDYYQQRILKASGVDINLNGAGGDELLAGYPAYYPPHMRWLWQQGVRKWPQIAADAAGIFENIPLADLWTIVKKKWGAHPASQADPFLRTKPEQHFAMSTDFSESMRQRMGEGLMYYWMRSQHKNYMHVPVEPRLPYLDVDLVDFCFTLPPDYLIRNGWTKYLLRRAVADILPPEIVWRKRKMGFPFDTKTWLMQQEQALCHLLRRDLDNPWIDVPAVLKCYPVLLKHDAQLLWRLVCLSLWHLKMIRQENLIP
ncbi:MAG: asparagine synthase (glutamine-hydrolyzing), partial [Saprospiraceae bacterium]|nr:asparagine synthase (glutamine-hydrolyzing) [Saprospiraceae bacterium]